MAAVALQQRSGLELAVAIMAANRATKAIGPAHQKQRLSTPVISTELTQKLL